MTTPNLRSSGICRIPVHFDNATVRYLETKDYDAYASLELDKEAKRYVGGPIKNRTHKQIVRFMHYKPALNLLAIADAVTDEYIGRCGLLDQEGTSETEIHIVLRRDYRKKGIALEVVPFLVELAYESKKQPIAIVDPDNSGSIALMNRLGWSNMGAIQKANYQIGHLRYEPAK